jgi:hypothetical protein
MRFAVIMTEITELAYRHHIQLPHSFLLLGKALLTMEGVFGAIALLLQVPSWRSSISSSVSAHAAIIPLIVFVPMVIGKLKVSDWDCISRADWSKPTAALSGLRVKSVKEARFHLHCRRHEVSASITPFILTEARKVF